MILVTGATGSNGTEIVKRLASRNVQVRAMVRDQNRASEIAVPNVEVVEGNFDRPETLLSALVGVERAFLLTNSSERAEAQQIAFIDAARQSDVEHIVKLSQFGADASSPGRFLRYHAEVEAARIIGAMRRRQLRLGCATRLVKSREVLRHLHMTTRRCLADDQKVIAGSSAPS